MTDFIAKITTDDSFFAAEVATNPRFRSSLMKLALLSQAEMQGEIRLGNAAIELAMLDTEIRLRAEEEKGRARRSGVDV